jgi:hypothetical protein
MNQLLLTVKTKHKTILIVIGSLILLYGVIWLSIHKPQMPSDIKTTIDSLTNVNKELEMRQKQMDSTIHVYEVKVKQVDHQIDSIKEKTTSIKKYYHKVSQQVSQYTPTELDSFFKVRYNY